MKLNTKNDIKKTVSIMANSELLHFDYDNLKTFHKGDSWFGCATGFRVMQIAERELSPISLWSREDLYVVSGHPGTGVKDAIELVTSTVSSERFRLLDSVPKQGCSNKMKFEWWISNSHKTLHIKMKKNTVPEKFFTKLNRLSSDINMTDEQRTKEHDEFDKLKVDLSNAMWEKSLNTIFEFEFLNKPLPAGELPDE